MDGFDSIKSHSPWTKLNSKMLRGGERKNESHSSWTELNSKMLCCRVKEWERERERKREREIERGWTRWLSSQIWEMRGRWEKEIKSGLFSIKPYKNKSISLDCIRVNIFKNTILGVNFPFFLIFFLKKNDKLNIT